MAYSGDADKKPPTEYLARKGEGKMDAEEFRAIVQSAVAQSVQWVDSELSVERARATKLYAGKPFGNEEEGRSQAILTEVRDAVDGMVPSLLRVFFGSEHTVEFVPAKADNVEQAAQKTDYVRYVFEEDNNGFLETMACLKDGLVRGAGIFKWGWDDSEETKAYLQEGLSEEELKALAATDNVTLTKGGTTKRADGLYDVSLTYTEAGGKAWVKALPPEEFFCNREARSIREALLVGHKTQKTRGQLLAMGIKAKDIDEHGAPGESDIAIRGNAEELARREMGGVGRTTGSGFQLDPEMGKANDKIQYAEVYMNIDFDGDDKGIAELRKICTIGPAYWPVKNDPTTERPFAVFSPYPEPHTLFGGSVTDRTGDVQKINSALLRGMLDSLSASIFPRIVYLEGQANVPDIMNTAIGAPARERVAGAIRTMETPFVGKEAMPIMSFMQEVIERRTGRNKGAAGLDADALQSTGKEAVGAVLTGSQEQIEMIARVFAESALKPMFRGLGDQIRLHQPKARMVKLRGQWVAVDPREWDDHMDVTVNVGLGTTFTDKKVSTLVGVAADQEKILMQMGFSNPLVTLAQFRNTRAKILSLQGLKDVDNYYQAVPVDWQPPPQQPQLSPEEMAMQHEQAMNKLKTVKELAIKRDELNYEIQKGTWEQEFKLRQQALDAELKKYQIDAQFHGSLTEAQLQANVQAEMKEAELTIAAHDQLHDQSLELAQHAHQANMDQQSQDLAEQQAQQAQQARQPEPAGVGD